MPGAGGNVGAVRAAQSAPDGDTFLVTGGNITNNPYLFSHAGYDPLKDFEAVTLGSATPVVLAVNPSVPAHTVKELVELIRANPGKYSFASPGTGTPPQLVGSLFAHALNLDLVHVPFGGGEPAVEATVGGHTPISFGALAPAVPLIKSGGLRALAVTGKERAPTLPDVPTMAEAGFPEVVGATWTAVVAPAGTPKDIVAKLNALIVAGLAQPDVKAKLAAMAYVAHRRLARAMRGVLQIGNGDVVEGDLGRRPARRVNPSEFTRVYRAFPGRSAARSGAEWCTAEPGSSRTPIPSL